MPAAGWRQPSAPCYMVLPVWQLTSSDPAKRLLSEWKRHLVILAIFCWLEAGQLAPLLTRRKGLFQGPEDQEAWGWLGPSQSAHHEMLSTGPYLLLPTKCVMFLFSVVLFHRFLFFFLQFIFMTDIIIVEYFFISLI